MNRKLEEPRDGGPGGGGPEGERQGDGPPVLAPATLASYRGGGHGFPFRFYRTLRTSWLVFSLAYLGLLAISLLASVIDGLPHLGNKLSTSLQGLCTLGFLAVLFFSPPSLDVNLGFAAVSVGRRRVRRWMRKLTPAVEFQVTDSALWILAPGQEPVQITSAQFRELDLATLEAKLRALARRGTLSEEEFTQDLPGFRLSRWLVLNLTRTGWICLWIVVVPGTFLLVILLMKILFSLT